MKQPFDDEKLVYDKTFHRYRLNHEGEILSNYIPNFNFAYGENALTELDSQSNNVYNYLYSQTHQANVEYFEYLLACDEKLRDLIFKMLIEQLRYDIQSGGNGIAYEHFIGGEARYERMVCNNVKLIIESQLHMNTGSDLGIRLPVDKYERWSY